MKKRVGSPCSSLHGGGGSMGRPAMRASHTPVLFSEAGLFGPF